MKTKFESFEQETKKKKKSEMGDQAHDNRFGKILHKGKDGHLKKLRRRRFGKTDIHPLHRQ
jgi:hypothetical protein